MSADKIRSSKPDVETLQKLKLAEQNLAAMLQKIDKEITQTDVEWMHLRSLVPKSSGSAPNPATNISTTTAKVQQTIDDESVNQTQLDLSLGTNQVASWGEEEEEESD